MVDTSAKILIDSRATQKYCRARIVPFALRKRVENELERLENLGVIEPIRFSEWAAPIVPIVKPDGSIRICGDFKVTVNQNAQVETYPLPRINDLLMTLSGGKLFSKLDVAHAFFKYHWKSTLKYLPP